jgi:hypothetical protein
MRTSKTVHVSTSLYQSIALAVTELLWEAKYYELQSLEKQLLRTTFFTRLLGDFASNPFESARTLMSRYVEASMKWVVVENASEVNLLYIIRCSHRSQIQRILLRCLLVSSGQSKQLLRVLSVRRGAR